MNQHRYSPRARELSCVIQRVKSSELTSFLYQGLHHWNKLPLEIWQCPSKYTFKYQVMCLLYSRLFVQGNQSICTFLILMMRFFCIFYQMMLISIICRVIFSEYYFKDHVGNKFTQVCFNVLSLVICHAC